MANINDIESLFSLIGQSPNDYKEFYHEKNGLHALDKWSYLKNIQLENPNEEGISIFENGPVNPSGNNAANSMTNTPMTQVPISEAIPVQKVAAFTPPDVVITAPKVERYTSPVIESKQTITPVENSDAPQTSTFSEPIVELKEPEPLVALEPLTPPVYKPANAPQSMPPAPKVYSTTAIPSVPTFATSFNSPVNSSTSTTFTSSFIKPTTSANSNLQSTFTPAPVEPTPVTKSANAPETKPNTQTASPLNSIFSRLEQK